MDIAHLREEYSNTPLTRKELRENPFEQFQAWMGEAIKANVFEANAMVLSTAERGRPSSRTVLLKLFDTRGFVFFTNYESRKAKQIAENPWVSATIFWKEISRQICIEGKVEKISIEESEAYFSSRPRGSQLGAWASRQSQPIPSYTLLEEEFHRFESLYSNQKIPLPPYWGGFRILPHFFEFWQGRENRLHDRFQYLLKNSVWEISRLCP